MEEREGGMEVPNYLPSISAAIGGVTPQRYVWRFCIGLHSAPRLIMGVAYLNFYGGLGASYWFCSINFLLYVFEILFLLLLTYVSSNENQGIHQLAFSFFMIFSLSHMIVTLLIWRNKKYSVSAEGRRSYTYKKRLFFFNLLSFSVSMLFYIRHNIYCEPGVYTIFALLEYLVVLSNIGFHMTACWDFGSKDLLICSPEEDKRI
ncbi:post-GPI attachment to proteins factor 2 [Mantella aurantiaca]